MTNEELKKYKDEYKAWCNTNRLRYAVDECGDPVSKTRSRRYPLDRLYCIYKHDMVGLHITRETPLKFRNVLRRLGLLEKYRPRRDDFEGNFQLSLESAVDVALKLKIKKTSNIAPSMGLQINDA